VFFCSVAKLRDVVVASRKRVIRTWRKAFNSLVALVTLSIWLEHNERVFRNVPRLPSQMVTSIMVELDNWCRASVVDRSSQGGE
jgi:hypothetical protein